MWTHKRVNLKNKPNPVMCTRANMKAGALVFTTGRNTHWARTKGSHQTCSMARALRQTSNTVVQGQTDMNTLVVFFPQTQYIQTGLLQHYSKLGGQ